MPAFAADSQVFMLACPTDDPAPLVDALGAKTPGMLTDGGLASGSEKRNAVIFGNPPTAVADNRSPVAAVAGGLSVRVLSRGTLGIAIQPTMPPPGDASHASRQQWDCVVAPSTRPVGPVFQITDFDLEGDDGGSEGTVITKWLKLSTGGEIDEGPQKPWVSLTTMVDAEMREEMEAPYGAPLDFVLARTRGAGGVGLGDDAVTVTGMIRGGVLLVWGANLQLPGPKEGSQPHGGIRPPLHPSAPVFMQLMGQPSPDAAEENVVEGLGRLSRSGGGGDASGSDHGTDIVGMLEAHSAARIEAPGAAAGAAGGEEEYSAAGGLLFSCLARGAGLYGRPNVEAAIFGKQFPGVST